MIAPAWWIAEQSGGPNYSRFNDESRISISKVVAEIGIAGEFEYRYDMGDGWSHRILEWVGGVFDPKGFDLNRINRGWRAGAERR